MTSGLEKVKEAFKRFFESIATFFKHLFKKKSDDHMGQDPDDLDEDLGAPEEAPPEEEAPKPIVSKKPAAATPITSKKPAGGGGKNVSVYFMSTIGPGEKKQKLLVNTGNQVGAIKQTVGNMFGLNPEDFHLSHGGVTLDEGLPLSNYNVQDGDTLLLIPASTAGTC